MKREKGTLIPPSPLSHSQLRSSTDRKQKQFLRHYREPIRQMANLSSYSQKHIKESIHIHMHQSEQITKYSLGTRRKREKTANICKKNSCPCEIFTLWICTLCRTIFNQENWFSLVKSVSKLNMCF